MFFFRSKHRGCQSARNGARPRATGLLAAFALAVVPTTVLAFANSDWFQQWTGGAGMMVSGESIGSLPAYLTPAEQADVPGLAPAQNALQAMPAIQVDVPHELAYSVMVKALGDGYAFIGPSSSSVTNARIRMFGKLDAKASLLPLKGRLNGVTWRVGSYFAGAKLVTSTVDKTTVAALTPNTTVIPLPIDLWMGSLASGPISLTLVHSNGAKASLLLSLVGDELGVVQYVP